MYIVYNDVFFRYPEIAEWSYTEAHVNSNLIYYAEIELNGKLGTHFSVPFSAAHPTIKDLSIDLAYVKGLRMKDPDRAGKIAKFIDGRIQDIRDGKEYIYTDSGTTVNPTAPGQGIWSSTMDYPTVHSMLDEDSKYTRVSSEMLYDLADERT